MAKRKKRQRLKRMQEQEAANKTPVVVSEPIKKASNVSPTKKKTWGSTKKNNTIKEKE